MSRLTDPEWCRDQYHDQSNLGSRIDLHSTYRTNPEDWPMWVFRQIHLPAEARILEVGCGSGVLWAGYPGQLPQGWQITLTDLSPGMLDAARQRLADLPLSPSFAEVDAQDIPFPDADFDAVIANFMLYHVPDLDRALSEIQRVLKPGGVLIAATVGAEHMRDLWTLLQLFDPALESPNDAWDDHHFTLESAPAELAAVFPSVTVHRYEDTLAVTDAAPLTAYATSMTHWRSQRPSDPETQAALTAFFEHELDRRGDVLTIRKVVGLFIAHKEE